MQGLPAPGAIVGGRYRIEAVIGQGAMGAVLRATDTTSGRAVAVKFLDPARSDSADDVLRLMSEAKAVGRIDHPNVVAILDVGREGQSPFLVMELLRGESLDRRLARGRLGPGEALDVVVRAGRGVAEAHREGVIHRDLKPANIFLAQSKDGTIHPKVVDFGVAKLYSSNVQLTATGVAVGTPRYMAPEQLGSSRTADVRCDVYSMGVVLYEALTGRVPFDGETIYELVPQIDAGPPPIRAFAPEVPPALEAVVLGAIRRDPGARPQTMRAFIDELDRARPVPPAPPLRARRSLLAIALVAGGALALTVCAGTGAALVALRRGDHHIARPLRERAATPQTTVELVLRGECSDVRLPAPYFVTRLGETILEVAAHDGSYVIIEAGLGSERTLAVESDEVEVRLSESGFGRDWSTRDRAAAGTVHLSRWQPDRGVMDATFAVGLIGAAGDTCTMDGRIATYDLVPRLR